LLIFKYERYHKLKSCNINNFTIYFFKDGAILSEQPPAKKPKIDPVDDESRKIDDIDCQDITDDRSSSVMDGNLEIDIDSVPTKDPISAN